MSSSSTYPTIDRRDLDFQLFEVLNVETLTGRSAHSDHDKQTFLAVLDTAQAIATEKFQNHYRESDLQEPTVVNGRVEVIPQVKQGLLAFAQAGFMNADRPYEEGGSSFPLRCYRRHWHVSRQPISGHQATTS